MLVWVYKYRYWDADRQEPVVSRDMYTMEAIRVGLGTPVLESATRVPEDQVDGNGRLKVGTVSKASQG
jgi:hypothetical protein